jgi:hypothetical protein
MTARAKTLSRDPKSLTLSHFTVSLAQTTIDRRSNILSAALHTASVLLM